MWHAEAMRRKCVKKKKHGAYVTCYFVKKSKNAKTNCKNTLQVLIILIYGILIYLVALNCPIITLSKF